MPLIQLDNQNPIRGLKLNINKINTLVSDENAPQQRLGAANHLDVLKPTALNVLGANQNQQQVGQQSRIPRLSMKFPALSLIDQNRLNGAEQQPFAWRSSNVRYNNSKANLIAPLGEKDKNGLVSSCKLDQEELDIEEEDEEKKEEEAEEEEIEDIDKSESRDAILLVCDIAKDIYEYMYTLEEEQAIKQDYLRNEKIFTPRVRQRLINWCIEIHFQLKLLPETLFLTVSLIDRFFDLVSIKQQSQVQLIAVGAMLIASKYEEIYPPDLGDLIHLTANAYSRREIMRIEIIILEQLKFNLGKPIPLAFLRRFSRAAHCDLKMHSIAKYLMELSLTEYECSHWRPSMLAAAALFVTIHLVYSDQSNVVASASHSNANSHHSLRRPLLLSSSAPRSPPAQDRWNKAMIHYTHYTRQQLLEPAATLAKLLKRAQKNPTAYYCVKKNLPNVGKWTELKSTRVDELIKLGDQI